MSFSPNSLPVADALVPCVQVCTGSLPGAAWHLWLGRATGARVGDPQACRPRALSDLAQLTIYFLAVDGLSAASDETEQIRSEFALSNFLTKKNALSKGMCL